MLSRIKLEKMITRRNVLAAGATSIVVAGSGFFSYFTPKTIHIPRQSWSSETKKLINNISQGKTIVQDSITLDIEKFIENGYQANFSVTMSEKSPSEIKVLYVIASLNPNPLCAKFYFTPSSGIIMVNSRLRLAKSQEVIALAEMKDGYFYLDKKMTDVHIKGCTP